VYTTADTTNFTMNTSQWDALNQFVEKVGWKFVFGLNGILRNPWPTGPWDSFNARLLLNYTISMGYDVNLELGNGKCHLTWITLYEI